MPAGTRRGSEQDPPPPGHCALFPCEPLSRDTQPWGSARMAPSWGTKSLRPLPCHPCVKGEVRMGICGDRAFPEVPPCDCQCLTSGPPAQASLTANKLEASESPKGRLLPALMLLLALLLPLLWAGSLQEKPSYWLQVEKFVTVQENLCVLVPCSFSYPQKGWNHSDPVRGYWYRQREDGKVAHTTDELVAINDPGKKAGLKSKAGFQLLGDPRAYNCSLKIAGAQKWDSGRYYFRVERGSLKYSYLRPMLTVTVTELTQTPDIHIPEPLVSGHLSRLLCSMPGTCSGVRAPRFSWNGSSLRPPGSGFGVHTSSEILLTPRPEDHGTQLTCRVTFPQAGVTRERTVQLSVSYPPQNLTVSVTTADDRAPDAQGNGSRVEAQKGQLLRLLCAADSRPPATLTWDLEGRVLAQAQTSGSKPLRLDLPGVKPEDAGRYSCRAENRLGSQHSSLELSVQYPPEDLRVTVSQANRTVLEILGNGTSLPMMEGQSLRLVCATHSSPPASLSWARGTQPLSPSWSSAPGVLELPRVQMEHEGEVTCHAENPLGTRSVSLSLSVHYAPQLLGPWCSWEAEGLRCSCSSRARPAPSLHWRLGEELLEGNSSNASFTVSSSRAGPWANSSLSLHGGLSSSLRLSCEAGNEHGAQSATVLLLPDRTPISAALSKGVFVGIGGTALLSLGLVLILVKALRTSRAQAEALRPKLSRRSTILDYINVIPKARPLARNQKAKPSSPSQIPSPETRTPVPKKNQKEQHWVSLGCPEPKTFTGKADSEISPEGLHYATLNFPGPRPRESQQPTDTHEDYAEIQFYPGPRRP